MNIYIDRTTGKATLSPSTLTYTVTVSDDFSLTKTIEVQEGEKQETKENNESIMVPNMIHKTVTLINNPEEFTAEEVIEAKYKSILEASECDHIVADMFLNGDDIDLTAPNHSANTGIAIMQLLPGGQAKTKEITLEATAHIFTLLEFGSDGVDIYIDDMKFVGSKAILGTAVDSCIIKFVNTTDRPKLVKSYAIGY